VRKETPKYNIPYHNAEIPPAEKLPVFMLDKQPLCSKCIVKPRDQLIPND
jgi:hypothetical protein